MNDDLNPSILDFDQVAHSCDLLIVGAGFEDRAFAFLSKCTFHEQTLCILITYKNTIPENTLCHERFSRKGSELFGSKKIFEIQLDSERPADFGLSFEKILSSIPGISKNIWIDISGIPSYAICCVLRACRLQYPGRDLFVVYTAALEYYPTKEEFELQSAAQQDCVEYLPSSMALGMSSILYIDSFSGHRSKNGATCLAVFAGYDAPRSSGAIDEVNPARLILLYGKPSGDSLKWRLNLSLQLHKRFEVTRNTAKEIVSTLNVRESFDALELYYHYLFDDFDFAIAPVCSKMQTVAAYLFWERYKEIQLLFPLPIKYTFERRPKGVDLTYKLCIPPQIVKY